MDQIEVEVIQPQTGERSIECPQCPFVTHFRNPRFGRDEQLLTRNAAFPDSRTDRSFVAIDRSGVDESVADSQRIGNDPFALGGIGYQKDTEALYRHLYSIVQFFEIHVIIS